MARTTMLTLTGISYTYPSMSEPLFEHVPASFQQGWTAVLGDNGLGKTTLLNIAIGMLPADTGSINPDPHGLTIATCPQDNMVRPKNLDDFPRIGRPEPCVYATRYTSAMTGPTVMKRFPEAKRNDCRSLAQSQRVPMCSCLTNPPTTLMVKHGKP